ncbi:MAG: Gfo/Idh/MocA family oxidoreductase [Bacteroidota bacterium]|nr:Gfo/Idh/MocA family oxidoreductase [Bacteroidota bacterium]
MTKHRLLSRRKFIGRVGTGALAFSIVPRSVLGGRGYTAPSDLPNVAGIGIGGRGASDIRGICTPEVFVPRNQNSGAGTNQSARPQARAQAEATRAPIKLANIYALCDVDSVRAANTFKGYPKAKMYTDWRELLQKENQSIDAVVIGTPDHNHAPIAAAFMREKKHIYVEKPMAKTIYECRKLAEIAHEMDVVTQMGNQGHAEPGSLQSVEWIQKGVIGDIHEVYCSTNRPIWPQGNLKRPDPAPVPETLNYDVWLGPAPEKPYGTGILPFNWRGLWDYGVGAVGDMGAHIMDVPIWGLELGMPVRIQASSTPYSTDYLPEGEWVTYEFAARANKPPVKLTWCDGGLRPPLPKEFEPGRSLASMGYTIYYGDKGIMIHGSHGAAPELIPADKDFKGPDPWLPRTKNIYEDWIDAIKDGKKSCNDFSISSKLTEIMLLANIAVLNQKSTIVLEYDAANMKITNLPEANNLFQYEYRKGWTL